MVSIIILIIISRLIPFCQPQPYQSWVFFFFFLSSKLDCFFCFVLRLQTLQLNQIHIQQSIKRNRKNIRSKTKESSSRSQASKPMCRFVGRSPTMTPVTPRQTLSIKPNAIKNKSQLALQTHHLLKVC